MSRREWQPEVLRNEFPALHQQVGEFALAYLDNAATTQKPFSVIQAMSRFYERDNANVHRGVHALAARATAMFEDCRADVARFLNASAPDEIVFTRGTTEAINLIAHSWGNSHVRHGDRLLLTPMEHHSNLVPWQRLAQRTGAELAFIPLASDASGTLDLATLDELLAPPTRLLAVAQVSNVLGTVNPVSLLATQARERGVITVVDGAQSVGHLPVDVREIGCDFLAFSGHKVCGPTGIGVLYGRRELLEQMEPWLTGGEMVERVGWNSATYAPPPQRFEAGTPPIAEAAGLRAALQFMDDLGRSEIAAHERRLTHYSLSVLRAIPGVRVLGSATERCGVFSFVVEGVHAHDLICVANDRGIALRGGHHCAQPLLESLGLNSVARASVHLYNTTTEVDRLAEAIQLAQELFL